MASSRYRVRDGIVLRRTPLPSGDVVVTLLSEDGKWRAIVRKGRLPGGNPGRLSLFHDVTVQAYRRRDDDLAVVTQVRLNGALPRLSDPDVYPYAHALAELADRLAVEVHLGEPLHAWLASGLRGLNADGDPERVALVHAWMMLRVAGLGPAVAAGPEGSAEGPARFDVAGGTLTRDGEGIALSPQGAYGLRRLATGRARDVLNEPLVDRALQWRLLARYVGWHVEQLRSLQAVTAMRAEAGADAERDAPENA
ncbi:MAG: DNA repair protein RecO C-terminal domain-containing protein [Trueperaceae bacterium]|nr:DNA repair protein RecO C-terminal domain-containing protein [Trueperaceae bacterium]